MYHDVFKAVDLTHLFPHHILSTYVDVVFSVACESCFCIYINVLSVTTNTMGGLYSDVIRCLYHSTLVYTMGTV